MEVDLERIRMQRKAEQGKAATLEQLIEIGRKRGYKRPELWAKHILNARQAKKLTGAM